MTKKSATISKILLIVSIILFLGVATYCGVTYFVKNDASKNMVTMFLNVNGGDFEQAPKGYLKDSNGSYKTTKKIGAKYGALPTPTRTGYQFTGWIVDSVTEKFVKANDSIEFVSNFTLVAQWEQQAIYDYVVNYFDDHGTKLKTSTSGMAMNGTMLTVDVPNIIGYTFNDALSEQTKQMGVDTFFDLYYTSNTYYISYAVNDNVVYGQKTIIHYGENINLKSIEEIVFDDSAFEIECKEFSHWEVNGRILQDGELITKSNLESLGFSLNFQFNDCNEIVLKAVFVNKKYNVYYNLNGNIFKEQSYESGKIISQPTNPDVAGYVFQGWYVNSTGATGTKIENNKKYNFVRDMMPEEDLYLYAGFSLQEYSLTLVVGDGVYPNGQGNKAIYTVEDDFILKPPAVEGKQFVGWTGEGISNPIVDLRIYKMTGNRIYYANYI